MAAQCEEIFIISNLCKRSETSYLPPISLDHFKQEAFSFAFSVVVVDMYRFTRESWIVDSANEG